MIDGLVSSGSRQSAVTLLREMADRKLRQAGSLKELADWIEKSSNFSAAADEALWELAIGGK